MNIPQSVMDTVAVKCLFCKKINIVSDLGWITQPHPVLAMLTKGKGQVTISREDAPLVVNELMDPYFMRSSLMRKPEVFDATGFEALVIHLSIDVLGGIELLHFFDIPIKYFGADKQKIHNLMLELFDLETDLETGDISELVKEKRILLELFEIMMRTAKPKKEGLFLNTDERGCLAAVAYLKEHFDEPFDIEKLLKLCHFSHAHFFRLFKKLTGVTPKNYQLDRRIEAAQKLLLTTNLSILEIGQRIGWPDQFHFSRIFKTRTGYSPQQFKGRVKLE